MQASVYATKQLRSYQTDAVNQVIEKIAAGRKSVLVVAPPGAGKTIIALELARLAVVSGQRVLFVAHRRELIAQASKTFDQAGIDHGVVMAGHSRLKPEFALQIASIQTLRRRVAHAPTADIVMIDEAHLAVASSYLQVLDKAYPKALRLGFTGTPERLDGKGLVRLFSDVVDVVTAGSLIADGHLVEPVIFAPSGRLDLSRVRTKMGDYAERDLDALMNNVALCGNIVDNWHKYAKGLSTIAFAVNRAHSQRIVDQFIAAGVPAEHVDCHTPKTKRDSILARLRSGETTLVSNVDILTEGFDYPGLKCVVLARPTKSYSRYLQAIGRVMRPEVNKTRAICLDHAGSVYEHGFPSDPRRINLEGATCGLVKSGLSKCPKCHVLLRTNAAKCGHCGWTKPLPPPTDKPNNDVAGGEQLTEVIKKARPQCPACKSYRVKEFRNAKLGPFTIGIECRDRACRVTRYKLDTQAVDDANDDDKRAEYQRLKSIQLKKDWTEDWTNRIFKNTFGHYPSEESVR